MNRPLNSNLVVSVGRAAREASRRRFFRMAAFQRGAWDCMARGSWNDLFPRGTWGNIPRKGSRKRRLGISLTELLISMFILLIGLLGVAAMFPVGSHYIVRSERFDRAATIGHAAAADMAARGYLRREEWNWLGLEDKWVNYVNSTDPYRFPGLAIDPLGVLEALDQNNSDAARFFPAPTFGDNPVQQGWPMTRVNLNTSNPAAELAFTCQDDLAFELPDASDSPLKLLFEKDGNGNPVRRAWNGSYSWIVTIGPAYYPNGAIATGDPSLKHEVSIVIIHGRTLLFPKTQSPEYDERIVGVQILSPGYGGGEVQLLANDPNKLKGIRQGEWLLLYGLDPNTISLPPALQKWFMHWYQMIATDRELDEGQTERFVTLKGPDWPWAMNTNIRAGLIRGAIAVYTKTMRLEQNSMWTIQ
ncbi:MAG: prepilin-type N-terminal cleavage/methylation domain-containing protein [Pirellulales bacterium]|nr:prepilin-type N-terminal cleavage/methylation domain-containing protein [Pirellulales bacterium]